MAPPALASLDNFTNARFRDVVGRHQYQVASEDNIIHKLYNHVSGNTSNVSAADVVSIDENNQGQWDLLLSTSANRLDANVITTVNTAAWSANSVISVREASTTIRSANVLMTGNLTVNGDIRFDSPTFKLDSANNRVGILNTSPAYTLDVGGDVSTNALTSSEILSRTGNVRIQSMTDVSDYTWASQTAIDEPWNDVAYGKGMFVAVASATSGNTLMRSVDGGVTWTPRSAGGQASQNDWTSITYGNGRWVAVSDTNYENRNRQALHSSDGILFQEANTPETPLPSQLYEWQSVAYGNGLFVAVASAATNEFSGSLSLRVMTSPTGIVWETQTGSQTIDQAQQWRSITFGDGLFVAVASSDSATGAGYRVMTSPDGLDWTSRGSIPDNDWSAVTYGDGLFVAVAESGTGDRVMTSPDGITWTSRTSAADLEWTQITYGSGLFVAVAQTGTDSRAMTSRDGITWTLRYSPSDRPWQGVVYGEGSFVAVANSGTSDRVMTWNLATTTANISGLMYYNESTGLVSYGSLNVEGLNARFGGLQVTEAMKVTDLDVSGTLEVGDLRTSGNLTTPSLVVNALTVSGPANFDGYLTRTFKKELGSSVGSMLEICNIDTFFGVFAVELVIVSNFSVGSRMSRMYQFCVRENATSGDYHRLLPMTAEAPGGIAVEIRSTSGLNSITTLRLVRVDTTHSGDMECLLKVYYDTSGSMVINELTGADTGVTASSIIYQNTLLTQVGGKVGIGMHDPSDALTVMGTSKIVDSVSPSTVFTQSTPTTFNFSDKWRLHYNDANDTLEIQRNTAGNWSTTALLADPR
jgi:hypothetical protein